jgi:hypothetical protein
MKKWLYLNPIAILIGFKLNVNLMASRAEDPEKETVSIETVPLTN